MVPLLPVEVDFEGLIRRVDSKVIGGLIARCFASLSVDLWVGLLVGLSDRTGAMVAADKKRVCDSPTNAPGQACKAGNF